MKGLSLLMSRTLIQTFRLLYDSRQASTLPGSTCVPARSYGTGQYTHCAGQMAGRAGSILAGFADDTYLSNVLFYS